jgi:hypothetical protein
VGDNQAAQPLPRLPEPFANPRVTRSSLRLWHEDTEATHSGIGVCRCSLPNAPQPDAQQRVSAGWCMAFCGSRAPAPWRDLPKRYGPWQTIANHC